MIKINLDNLTTLDTKKYDLNFICYLADRFLGEEDIEYSSRWSQDSNYRYGILKDLETNFKKGTVTEEESGLIKQIHRKPTQKNIVFIMNDAVKHGKKRRGEGKRNKKINIGFWTFVYCLNGLIKK